MGFVERPGQIPKRWLDTDSVSTYSVFVNLTISVDDKVLERARLLAARRGTSVQELLRRHLEQLVGRACGESVAEELLELMQSHGGHSGHRRIGRDEAYEDAV